MSGRESLITVGAIAAAWAIAQLLVWIRAWRAHRIAQRAEEQLQLELRARRGWRALQRMYPEDIP